MPTVVVDFVAILVAAIVSMAVGFIWYSKPLFAKAWLDEVGLTEEKLGKGPGIGFLWAFIAALVTAYVMAHFVQYTGAVTAGAGAATGFWIWLGFVATSLGMNMIFEQKSLKLFSINAGMQLANFIIMGALLAGWR